MTTQQQNERLTRVGPSTPMGNLLRRYWHPIGTVLDLDKDPVQKVRLLGENLTLYRSERGEYGLLGDRCPHRCLSMEYGIPDERGLRCAYHGWLYDAKGRCLEQPFEDRTLPDNPYKDKVTIKGAIVEGQPMPFEQALTMPTREEAIAQIIAMIVAPGSAIAGCLTGPASQVASQIKSISEKEPAAEAPAPAAG